MQADDVRQTRLEAVLDMYGGQEDRWEPIGAATDGGAWPQAEECARYTQLEAELMQIEAEGRYEAYAAAAVTSPDLARKASVVQGKLQELRSELLWDAARDDSEEPQRTHTPRRGARASPSPRRLSPLHDKPFVVGRSVAASERGRRAGRVGGGGLSRSPEGASPRRAQLHQGAFSFPASVPRGAAEEETVTLPTHPLHSSPPPPPRHVPRPASPAPAPAAAPRQHRPAADHGRRQAPAPPPAPPCAATQAAQLEAVRQHLFLALTELRVLQEVRPQHWAGVAGHLASIEGHMVAAEGLAHTSPTGLPATLRAKEARLAAVTGQLSRLAKDREALKARRRQIARKQHAAMKALRAHADTHGRDARLAAVLAKVEDCGASIKASDARLIQREGALLEEQAALVAEVNALQQS
eukprot:TRINITY_DN21104_c0_g1_i1.p1 TRINITY_DN21104_c0_g1~~TRINITY_DN21104_c0_g1_i1.p1  ORF type:complete len:450 (+),score=118.67 TRINITY_DN21104_c0_g1_i1:120-1352(+)